MTITASIKIISSLLVMLTSSAYHGNTINIWMKSEPLKNYHMVTLSNWSIYLDGDKSDIVKVSKLFTGRSQETGGVFIAPLLVQP